MKIGMVRCWSPEISGEIPINEVVGSSDGQMVKGYMQNQKSSF